MGARAYTCAHACVHARRLFHAPPSVEESEGFLLWSSRMKIDWTVIIKLVVTVLVGVLGWIASQTLVTLTSIRTELNSIKLELVKVQASMMTEDTVRLITRDELHRLQSLELSK